MATCQGFEGTAALQRTGTVLSWTQADPGIHVSDVLLEAEFLLEKYEIVEPCPTAATPQHHARLRHV